MIQTGGVIPADKGRTRKAIRKAITTILKGNTAAGDRVYPSATAKVADEELPVILVYATGEPAAEFNTAPRELQRNLTMEIEIIAKGPEENSNLTTPNTGVDTLDDVLDDLAEAVEVLMHADDTLGGVCSDSILSNTELEYEGEGAQAIGSVRLTYTVTYYTHAPRANPTLDDFESNEVDWRIHPPENEDNVEAEDTVDLDT